MTDPRFVEQRCHERMNRAGDYMRRSEFVCMFVQGHAGLHYSKEMWVEGQPTLLEAHEVVRWGSQEQLEQEVQ